MVNATIRIETRLKNVLLSVALDVENELLALVGRSGAGKTMILRAIAGVFVPDTATIEIDDRPMYSTGLGINIPAPERRIGYVPQSHALYPHLTVADNVAISLSKQQAAPVSDAERRVSEVLDLMALWRVRTRFPADLDALTLQRVALARAVVGDPALLLMDDPYGALTTEERRAARAEFVSLRRQLGVPTLFATGELDEAYEIADRIALLDDGAILQIAAPRTLLTRPLNRRVADIVRSVNVLAGEVLAPDAHEMCGDSNGHGGLVRTSLGLLRFEGERPFATTVDVTIRPEEILLIELGDRRENALLGTITSTTRHGPYVGVVVRPHEPEGAEELHLFVSEHVFRERAFAEGNPCAVALPPAALNLMPRDVGLS